VNQETNEMNWHVGILLSTVSIDANVIINLPAPQEAEVSPLVLLRSQHLLFLLLSLRLQVHHQCCPPLVSFDRISSPTTPGDPKVDILHTLVGKRR